MTRKIRFTIRPRHQGGTKIEAVGFSGPGCETAIKQFADKLGGKLERLEHEPEYFQREAEQERERE